MPHNLKITDRPRHDPTEPVRVPTFPFGKLRESRWLIQHDTHPTRSTYYTHIPTFQLQGPLSPSHIPMPQTHVYPGLSAFIPQYSIQ